MIKILKFEAEWCGACKVLDGVLEKVVEATGVEVQKIDVDKEPELAAKFQIMGLPRVIIQDESGTIDDFAGVRPAEYIIETINNS